VSNELQYGQEEGSGADLTAIVRPFAATIAVVCAAAISNLAEPAAAQNAVRAVPTISTGHTQGVERLAFSPDGRQLASGAGDRLTKIWDVASGRMLQTLSGMTDSVDHLAYSADGRRIVAGKNVVKTWDAETGAPLWTLNPPDDQNSAHDFVLTRDNQLLVLNSRLIRRYDLVSAQRRGGINPFSDVSVTDEFSFAFHFSLSPDERLIALGYSKSSKRPLARVAIVNAATGAQLQALDSHSEFISALAFSPDSRLLASASHDKTIKIWDVASGQMKTLSGNPNAILQIAWSPDGKRIYSIASVEKAIRIWDVASGTLVRKIDTPLYWSSMALSPDGKIIATGGEEIDLWDVETGALIRKMEGGRGERGSVSLYAAPSADKWIATAGKPLQLWDGTTGQLARTLLPDADYYSRIAAPEPDSKGRWLHATNDKNRLRLWDAASGDDVATFTLAGFDKDNIEALSRDGRLLATQGYKPRTIALWDMTSGKRIWSIPTPWEFVFRPAFSPDSRWLIATVHEYDRKEFGLKIWDVSSGRLANTIAADRNSLPNYASYSPDQKLAVARGGKPMTVYDMTADRKLWSADERYDIDTAAFAPDSRTIIAGESSGIGLTIWDARSGQLIRTLYGNAGHPGEFMFLQGGRRVVVGNSNGTSTIWNPQTGELLATIAQQQDGEWLTITPEGFFVASQKGDGLMHIVRGFETIGIDQVYQSLYRPDLVREKLAGDPRGLVREAAAQLDLDKVVGSGNAPDVRVTLPGRALGTGTIDGASVAAEAEITDRGGGIGRVEWRVNGITAGIDAAAPGSAGRPVRLTRSLVLDPGDNTIEVVAYNSANLISSVPARASVAAQVASPSIVPSQPVAPSATTTPAPVAAAKPRLFVLVAGVNDYADKRFTLSYAVSDAKEVARGFQQASGNLYQSVEVRLMIDAEVTRDRLDAAFAEMAGKTAASDVFVLYLAGHGKTVDGRYYFAPQDFAVDGELSDKAINAAVKAKAIAQDQWQRWFASISARKSVILFDTCDSGTLAGDETQQLEKGAANDRLSQATGRSILAASGGSQQALEGYHGHGLFTYEILDAINQADGDRSGTVELNELAAYVYAQVSELSQKVFNQRQVPEMKITANFPLATQTRILQDEVTPIAEAKPTYQLAQTAQLQIKPSAGATVVRSLSAKTPVTVLESNNGWSLVASEGKPLGYVATRDLAPVQ
jgi:WD40 repeat protein